MSDSKSFGIIEIAALAKIVTDLILIIQAGQAKYKGMTDQELDAALVEARAKTDKLLEELKNA